VSAVTAPTGTLTRSSFSPAWWLPGTHLQTVVPNLLRRPPRLEIAWERFALSDGDFLELGWTGPDGGPLCVLLHGLGGSHESAHMRGLARRAAARGWRVCLFHFRGCANQPNTRLTTYHNGMTADPREVLRALAARFPDRPRVAVGVSLGGNALLRLLGEDGAEVPLTAAAAFSVAVELRPCADRLNRGLSRGYQAILLRRLRARLAPRRALLERHVDYARVMRARSFWEFDAAFTAPVHGYASAADYYARASCRPVLRQIAVPTLIFLAADDPFLGDGALPRPDDLSPHVRVEIAEQGGHVGFVAGQPWRPVYYLEERLDRFLGQVWG
jgi:predicted alpha/beta-fold hydrolase